VVIAKPEASSQGKGIFLSKNIDDFDFGEHYVVQKYLKRPFILDGLKFDLRVYVLVAGCDPLRLYIYKEGLARFATECRNVLN
jgi:tubulin polyglutamylase TTLL6/13